MGTTRLQVYNAALFICGERQLASLTENRQPRFLLDSQWNDQGILHCLEKGQWIFATRASKLDYDPTLQPTFGYRRGFIKNTDWVSTTAVCQDEYYRNPLTQYADEAGVWFADLDIIYVKYVSSDPAFGMNLALWPSSFADYVGAHFAAKIVNSLTGDKEKRLEVQEEEKRQLFNAKSMDNKAQPTRFPAQGSWSRARHGNSNWRDGGNRGSLIG